MNVPVKKRKLHKQIMPDPGIIKYPEELIAPESDPEIIPYDDPFESPADNLAVPGEGP
jgi:hypothetical protein